MSLSDAFRDYLNAPLEAYLKVIVSQSQQILERLKKMATALQDLQAIEAQIVADQEAIGTAVQAVVDFIKAHPPTGVSDADIEAVVAPLATAHASFQASASALTAAVNPPAPPAQNPPPAGA